MSILDLPTGLHRNVPPEVYHTKHKGLASKGILDLVHRSPAHYLAHIDGVTTDETTPALEFGSAFHCALLEPSRFAAEYIVQPDFCDCRKTVNKAERDEWRARNGNKRLLSADDAAAIRAMVASVCAHPLASKLLRDGDAELTARWTDEETGLPCRARADYYVPKLGLLVDVKTTQDASREAFRRDVAKYGYHRIDGFYRPGFQAAGARVEYYLFLAVEKTAPWPVAVYSLGAQAIGRGRDSVRADMETLARCLKTNEWPGYGIGIQELELAPWAA